MWIIPFLSGSETRCKKIINNRTPGDLWECHLLIDCGFRLMRKTNADNLITWSSFWIRHAVHCSMKNVMMARKSQLLNQTLLFFLGLNLKSSINCAPLMFFCNKLSISEVLSTRNKWALASGKSKQKQAIPFGVLQLCKKSGWATEGARFFAIRIKSLVSKDLKKWNLQIKQKISHKHLGLPENTENLFQFLYVTAGLYVFRF